VVVVPVPKSHPRHLTIRGVYDVIHASRSISEVVRVQRSNNGVASSRRRGDILIPNLVSTGANTLTFKA
jgi:hypothetical protein